MQNKLLDSRMSTENRNLNEYVWYRVLQLVAGIILIATFISPWFRKEEPSVYLILDGTVNVLVWLLILFILKKAILYIVFGKQTNTERSEKKFQPLENWSDFWKMTLWIVCAIAIIWFIYKTIR